MKITPGRIVLYVLSEQDAEEINRRRTNPESIRERHVRGVWPAGAQAHIGNPVEPGQTYPAIVVRVWDAGGDINPAINLKVLLDGNDDYWARSRLPNELKTEGTWHWPYVPAPETAVEPPKDQVPDTNPIVTKTE